MLDAFLERRRGYFAAAGAFSALVLLLGLLAGIAERRSRLARRERSRQEARFRATFDQEAVGIAHTDLDGRFLKTNGKLCAMLGYAEAELLQRTFPQLTHPDDMAASKAAQRAGLEKGESSNFEKRYLRKDGSEFWASVSVSPVPGPDGAPEYFVTMVLDIAAQKEAQGKLLYQAQHDTLTGLPNRALFHDRLGMALSQARRQGWVAGLLYLDLDKFKQVNDKLGHAAGDALLREIAARLSSTVRASDTAARIGGDEFAVVLAQLAAAGDAAAVAEKILAAMAEPMSLEGHECVVTVSIGIALFPQGGEDVETLVRNADEAMFRAKQAGRNAFCMHEAVGA